MSDDLAYTWLPKDKDFIYCFLREQILQEEDCDYYEHNLECDEKNDVWGRTHFKGSHAGYKIRGVNGNVLNSCDYCLKEQSTHEKFILPQKAKINKKKSLLNRLFGD